MLAPLSWLKEFVDIPDEPKILAERIFEHSCEINEIIDRSQGMDHIVSGKILEIKPHPDADKLRVCQVDIGSKKVQILTNALNVSLHDIVPVALSPAVLPSGLKIKRTAIRGVDSEGMFCSAVELRLANQADGIFIFSNNTPIGVDIVSLLKLDDIILDLDILPNRGDLMSIRGLARELSVIYDNDLNAPIIYSKNEKGMQSLIINNDAPDQCNRYLGVVIDGVVVAESPQWMQDRLLQVGINPINNIVDITNFVLMELGQPLHAFSMEFVCDNTITIRFAKENEELAMLNGDVLELSETHLIIADSQTPLALAGVMGGSASSIHNKTTSIMLESAYFNPTQVRRTAFQLGIHTDSSKRFEKGVDVNGVDVGFRRAIQLILDIAGGHIASAIQDNISDIGFLNPEHVPFRSRQVSRLLGIDISEDEIKRIMHRLEFQWQDQSVVIPTFRKNDILREADIIEEIGRYYGFNKIPSVLPPQFQFDHHDDIVYSFSYKCRQFLSLKGFNEVISYSMTHPDDVAVVSNQAVLELENPLSKMESVLRPTLLVSLLNNARYNLKNLESGLKIFETGNVFALYGDIIQEKMETGCLVVGNSCDGQTIQSSKTSDLYDLKGTIEQSLVYLGIKNSVVSNMTENPFFHPYRNGAFCVGKDCLVTFGEIHPSIAKSFEIAYPIHFAQWNHQAI